MRLKGVAVILTMSIILAGLACCSESSNTIDDNESITVSASTSSLDNVFAAWSGSNAFINIKYEGPYWIFGKSYDMQKHWEALLKNTEYTPHGGFAPDYTTVNTIRASRRMSFTRQVEKMERGVYQEKDADEYIEEMKKANTDELVRAIQKQLDEWRN